MADELSHGAPDGHRRTFDRIWSQMPERQNRTSSSWWFFILFPEGEDGYGPRQLMFSIATRAGEDTRVNGVEAPGIDPDRPVEDGVDRFDAITVGWYGDDERVVDYAVNQPARATLSDGSLVAWADREDGTRRGGEITASAERLGLDAHFAGEDVEARFEAWGDLDSRTTSPDESMDVDSVLGGGNLVGWRRMNFEGEFDLSDGRESLEGLCYFQRVCFNVPLFPWKWVWALFPDGTAVSVLVPFLGPQLFRKGYRFFSSNALERATVPIKQSGLWEWGDSGRDVGFDEASVTPVLDGGSHPEFEVRARNDRGDYVEFLARPYGHTRNYLDRPVLGGLLESHWSYNEYLVRLAQLEGRIDGTVVTAERMGQGYGTLEYSYGAGL